MGCPCGKTDCGTDGCKCYPSLGIDQMSNEAKLAIIVMAWFKPEELDLLKTITFDGWLDIYRSWKESGIATVQGRRCLFDYMSKVAETDEQKGIVRRMEQEF